MSEMFCAILSIAVVVIVVGCCFYCNLKEHDTAVEKHRRAQEKSA